MKRKTTRILMMKDLEEIISHYSAIEPEFILSVGNYSVKVETPDENILFSDTQMRVQAFAFYQKMKKDIGGEIREIDPRIKFFDFSGIRENEFIPECYSVDINSAYLTALKNEGVITEATFNEINEATKKNALAKSDRLKSVGMFARNTMKIQYINGQVQDVIIPENPYSWVFFLACKMTTEAMEKCKKIAGKNFVLYWVDGIFTRENPEQLIDALDKMNFSSKIEKIENLRVNNGSVLYTKDGEEKILFLPRNNKQQKTDLFKKLKNAIPLKAR